MKIGVFDSGKGGLSMANAIKAALPEHQVIFKNDCKNVPYGTKKPEILYDLVVPIFDALVDEGCVIIVIACNTVTMTIIEQLRERYSLPLIGLEPMVKTASKLSKSGTFVVCATPTTLGSVRYNKLKEIYAQNNTVIEPNCSGWAELIEDNNMNEMTIRHAIEPAVNGGADVIVLGCTHYHWIESEIENIVRGRAIVLHPEAAVVRRVKSILAELPV